MNKNKSTEVFCRPSGEVKKKNHCKLFFHSAPPATTPPKLQFFKRGFSVPEKHLWDSWAVWWDKFVPEVGFSLAGAARVV